MKRVPLITLIVVAGCATLRPPTSSIWEPRTEFGRSFKARYQGKLENALKDLRSIPEIGDIVAGLWLGAGADSSARYFGANMGTYNKYNTLRTNFEERAASAVSELILPVLQAIAKQKEPIDDLQIAGVYVSIAWTAADFSERYSGGELEAVQMYIPKDIVFDFLSFKFTNQDLLNKSLVFGYKSGRSIGRIQFNIGKNF